jgi:hypothetical protein
VHFSVKRVPEEEAEFFRGLPRHGLRHAALPIEALLQLPSVCGDGGRGGAAAGGGGDGAGGLGQALLGQHLFVTEVFAVNESAEAVAADEARQLREVAEAEAAAVTRAERAPSAWGDDESNTELQPGERDASPTVGASGRERERG